MICSGLFFMTPAADRTAETWPAYGLFPVGDFQLTTGAVMASSNSDIFPQALWFSLEETIAVPAPRVSCCRV